MKFTAIRDAVAKQLGLRRNRRALQFARHGGLKSTAGAMVLAGGMTFVGSAHLASAQTELLLNGSFENNDGFNGDNVGFDWVAGNAGGIFNGGDQTAPPAVFDVYNHGTQQYGGFDPDTFLGGDTAGDWYFHTVGLSAFDGGGTAESPVVQQTVDVTTRPAGEDFFSLSAIMSGFGADAAQISLTFWDAAGGIGGGGSQVGQTFTLDGTAPNATASNLDGSAWANNSWSSYLTGGSIPGGAVSATVQILQATIGGGNQNDNYVDLVSLQTVDELPGDPALTLTVDRDTGEITLSNGMAAAASIQGYAILSPAGTLVESNWTSVDDNYDVSGSGQVDSTSEWVEFTAAGSAVDLSEGSLGAGSIASGTAVSLGVGAWAPYYDEDELQFEYLDGAGDLQGGIVEFTGVVQSTPFEFGDLNFDGSVDGLDWDAYVANLGNSFASQTDAAAYVDGDLNNDGVNDALDFLAFRAAFDAANGAGALQALIAGVPEPSSVVIVMAGVFVFVAGRRCA